MMKGRDIERKNHGEPDTMKLHGHNESEYLKERRQE